METITRLAELTSLYVLTCQAPGRAAPHGLVQYKVRALTPDAARDQVWALHPEWTIEAIRAEPTDGTPTRLGAMMATESRP